MQGQQNVKKKLDLAKFHAISVKLKACVAIVCFALAMFQGTVISCMSVCVCVCVFSCLTLYYMYVVLLCVD